VDPGSGTRPTQLGQPVEHLDQLQLVVEVVLEPEHDLIVLARAAEGGVPLGKGLSDLGESTPASIGNEARSLLGKRFERQPGAHRPFVQHVAPGKDGSLHHLPDDGNGVVAVGDVQQRVRP